MVRFFAHIWTASWPGPNHPTIITTISPLPEILPSDAGTENSSPAAVMLTRSTVPSSRSLTKTSSVPLVSSGTSVLAEDDQAT